MYNVCFFQNLAQTKGKVVTCDAGTKIQNVCKMANDLFSSQIDKLTLNFMDNAERIILSMFDVCNNSEFLQATWSTSPKISYLLAYILEFADQFLDYISSLTALDIEIEFELGWAEIEDDEGCCDGDCGSQEKTNGTTLNLNLGDYK